MRWARSGSESEKPKFYETGLPAAAAHHSLHPSSHFAQLIYNLIHSSANNFEAYSRYPSTYDGADNNRRCDENSLKPAGYGSNNAVS